MATAGIAVLISETTGLGGSGEVLVNPTNESTVGHGSLGMTTGEGQEARRRLYQKLGWCMIRLQQVELCMKWLAGRTELESSAGDLSEQLDRNHARTSKQTLGSVAETVSVGLFKPLDWEPPGDLTDGPPGPTVRLGIAVGLEGEHLASVQSRLKDLVARRNLLVHGLIASHDIWSSEGCAAAEDYVDESLKLADAVLTELRGWVSTFADLARMMASAEMQHLLFGVGES